MKHDSFSKKALVVAMGVAITGGAQAAWTGAATTLTILTDAKTAELTDQKSGADPVYTLGGGESLTANDTIAITLTGGAVFGKTNSAKLTPSNPACDIGNGAGVASVPLSFSDDRTTATWRSINDKCVAGNQFTLNANSAAIFTVTGVSTGANVDATLSLKTGTGLAIGPANQSLKADKGSYLFATTRAMTTTAFTAQEDTASVETGYTKLIGNTLNGTATTFTVRNNAGGLTLPANYNLEAKGLVFGLVGDFAGISKVNTAAGLTGSSATGDTTGGKSGEFLINAAKTEAYVANSAALNAGASVAAGPRFILDGTTVQTERSFTGRANVTSASTKYNPHPVVVLNGQTSAPIYTVKRDGVATNVTFANLAEGANQVIIIRDESNGAGFPAGGANILVTIMFPDGSTANGTLTSRLTAGGTLVLTPSDIISQIGATVPAGAGHAQINLAIQSKHASVTNLTGMGYGWNNNAYSSTPKGGGL